MKDKLELDIEEMMTKIEGMTKSFRLNDAYNSITTEGLQMIWDQYSVFLEDDHSDGSYADSKFELWLEGYILGYSKGRLHAAEEVLRKL